jgi:hypothetical protein
MYYSLLCPLRLDDGCMIGAIFDLEEIPRMRTQCFRVMLLILGLLFSSSLRAAENPDWNNLKQLSPGQQVRLLVNGRKSFKGQFRSVTDDAVVVHANGADQTLSRSSVQEVSSRRPGHRGRHALIGAAIGAGSGLGIGAAIDNDCSSQSIVCTGNKGKAILAPVFGLVGAGIGAALPAGRWQEVYRSN